jgi:hypothetical protein
MSDVSPPLIPLGASVCGLTILREPIENGSVPGPVCVIEVTVATTVEEVVPVTVPLSMPWMLTSEELPEPDVPSG